MNKQQKLNKYCFGLGTVGRDALYTLISMYMMNHLTGVVGLDDAALAVITTIFLICRIFDSVNDPFMGVIVDNTKTRWGKFKPWILIGMLSSGVLTILLFNNFNMERDIELLQTLTHTRLTESQFAQIVGRMRLYQALPSYMQRKVPKLLITDSQINNVCRDYYNNPNFGAKDSTISMFDFHNLLTEANKSSYIDSYVQRGINATEVTVGICKALQGDSEYSWFLC